jgi:RecA/RadA recombinase
MAKADKTLNENQESTSGTASKWMAKLRKHEAAVKYELKGNETMLRSPSPGVNYLFGKKMGMMPGYTMLLYGPQKSGKSLLSLALAGQLHRDDPNAIVLHFDTEMRETMKTWAKVFGIDMNRIASYSTNRPEEIFDFIAKDVNAMIQDGAPIKMIIVDSLAAISYPKEANAESTTNHIMGDAAAYLNRGMKAILPVIRRNGIYTVLCQHVRENMDPQTAKYRKYIIPGGRGLKHLCEYFVLCEQINSKDSRILDETRKDGSGNPIQTGHMIRVTMEDNSDGPKNRKIEIKLSYKEGIVDQHEEIATLAVNMGVIERPNNMTYAYKDKKWVGYNNFLAGLKDDTDLQKELLEKVVEQDLT